MLACALTMLPACERPGDARAREEGSRSIVSSEAVSANAPLVVVAPDSPRFKQLRVEAVRQQSFPTDEIVAPARVIINPNRISRVLPPVQGRVLTVAVKRGDTVEEGQPLVTLDSPDADAAISAYLQADATLRQARVTLGKTEADLKRARNLLPYQAISEKDALAAQNDYATAQGALENVQATREQALRTLTLLGLKPTELKQGVGMITASRWRARSKFSNWPPHVTRDPGGNGTSTPSTSPSVAGRSRASSRAAVLDGNQEIPDGLGIGSRLGNESRHHVEVTVSAAVGFISLFGVAVTLLDAVAEGARVQFRPRLILIVVAALGMLPAALARGIGSDIQRPLATVVIGGLCSTLFLTLFALPALYWLTEPFRAAPRPTASDR